jgi:excisionase family DNA binding protein
MKIAHYLKHVKIVSANGGVTLRGSVKPEEEKPLSRAKLKQSLVRARSTVNSKLRTEIGDNMAKAVFGIAKSKSQAIAVADQLKATGFSENDVSVLFPDKKGTRDFVPRIMTLEETADYLRVHPSTIYRLLKKRQLPAFRVGSDWRFNVESIDRWREEAEMQTSP